MRGLISLFFSCATLMTKIEAQDLNLMPWPKDLTKGSGKFHLTNSFDIDLASIKSERLRNYTNRTLKRIASSTGLNFYKNLSDGKTQSSSIAISYKQAPLELYNQDESYQLSISTDKITLNSQTDLGAMRGLETLVQLLNADTSGYYYPNIVINDAPRFMWRGLLLDVSRHFIPLEIIKRNIDGMASVKMNVLHLHLSDDQGFRVESKKLPKLHELGSSGEYFRQNEIRELIKYAGDRGIRVIPEFDLPGHATSWFAGYPELASIPRKYVPETKFGIFDPAFDPTKETTYTFLDTLFKEMTSLFPDPFFHIGGDENNGKDWEANSDIQKFMRKNQIRDNHQLQAYFNKRLLTILTKYRKNMIGWDEIMSPDMPQSVVIQSWRGKEGLQEAAKKGYKTILSNGYYIDLVQPASFHYSNDPIPQNTGLSEAEQKNILGGEATMWSEFITTENIDSRIWPRTAAIAERLWSTSNINDTRSMYKRLQAISVGLEHLGLKHEVNYDLMLRRLAGKENITALKTLTDVIEPVKIYERYNQGVDYSVNYQLVDLADAARPDAPAALRFQQLAEDFIKHPNDTLAREILKYLGYWKNNHDNLIRLIKNSPMLKEAMPLAENLKVVAETGIEIMTMYTVKSKPKSDWISSKQQQLKDAKKPKAKCELMIVGPIEELLAFIAKSPAK